ncbi:MAG TPA: helix-turn-helix domain-containing protein [Telluria sp.]|nr:helix-turn-helix domain-containing protein [Telluria sp.]
MRADARKNYEHVLAVAREVIAEQGADASLRDIARKAEVGLGTLYRHFPTREALLEALLRESFDAMTARAAPLFDAADPGAALVAWFREMVLLAHRLSGITSIMMAAIEAPDSALHASCVTMKSAGARLLARAQEAGVARRDMDGADLFALVGALAWIGDQPSLVARFDHLFEVISGAVVTPIGAA